MTILTQNQNPKSVNHDLNQDTNSTTEMVCLKRLKI